MLDLKDLQAVLEVMSEANMEQWCEDSYVNGSDLTQHAINAVTSLMVEKKVPILTMHDAIVLFVMGFTQGYESRKKVEQIEGLSNELGL